MHLNYQYYAGDSSSWSCAIGILLYVTLLCISIQYMPPSVTWMRAMTQSAPTWLRHQRDRLASLRRPWRSYMCVCELMASLTKRLWCPAAIACFTMIEQLGLFVACQQRGDCRCYLNGTPLHDDPVAVTHGDFLAMTVLRKKLSDLKFGVKGTLYPFV